MSYLAGLYINLRGGKPLGSSSSGRLDFFGDEWYDTLCMFLFTSIPRGKRQVRVKLFPVDLVFYTQSAQERERHWILLLLSRPGATWG